MLMSQSPTRAVGEELRPITNLTSVVEYAARNCPGLLPPLCTPSPVSLNPSCFYFHYCVHFCFDFLTVGHETAGLWHCFRHPVLGAVLRNTHRLIETRFDPNISHWHVKSHSGHPGNELVDNLADSAYVTDAGPTA